MPIRPENRDRYPKDWPAVSLAVRVAAGWRCQCAGECGAFPHPPAGGRCWALQGFPHPVTGSRVVLTVAHLNHDPGDNRRSNHLAMCQRCHLAYDKDHHAATRARARTAAATTGMSPLFTLTEAAGV